MIRAAIVIQALARGYNTRIYLRTIYKKLVKAREKRIFERKTKASVKIQTIVRMRQAWKHFYQKQEEFQQRERRRKQLEELDARLDDIHETHLNDLLAVRVQQGVRGKLARK
jgi:uncharacterized protein YjiS (DUF1127 family)